MIEGTSRSESCIISAIPAVRKLPRPSPAHPRHVHSHRAARHAARPRWCTSPLRLAPFTQYTAELEPGGSPRPGPDQRSFTCSAEGEAGLATGTTFNTDPRSFAYLPEAGAHTVTADETTHSRSSRNATTSSPPYLHLKRGRADEEESSPSRLSTTRTSRFALFCQAASFDFAVNTMTLRTRRRSQHGRDPRHGTRTADARRRRHLPPRRRMVSGHRRRFHLDGAVLPAVVRRARQNARKISDLQRLEPAPASM